MVNEVKNVLAGKPLAAGGVWRGPLGSTLPTNASTALNASIKATGYISEDGLTETVGRTTENVKAWGGDIVKVLQTEYSVTYQFTFLESIKTEVLEAVYGADNVTKVAATVSTGTLHTVVLNSDQMPHEVFVFEVRDGDARLRIVVPDGQITEVGDVTYNDGSVIGYPVTVTAFKDSTLGGQAVKYIDDGVFDAA
jgi:hypothetical protein